VGVVIGFGVRVIVSVDGIVMELGNSELILERI